MKRQMEAGALLAVLALAFGLRIWSVGWGMPYAFHADEHNYLAGAIRMLTSGDLNPHYFNNPPLLTYTVLIELLPYLWVGKLLGLLHSAADVKVQLDLAPTPLYILARMNGVVLGTGTVLITYLTAKRLLEPKTALLSALLLAVAFLHVRDSHYAVNDVPATFLLAVSFYFATRLFTSRYEVRDGECSPFGRCARPPGRLRDYMLGGLFLGLAVATKYNVGLGAVALIAAHLLSLRGKRIWPRLSAHLPLMGAGAVSLLAFALANPFSVLDAAGFLEDFVGQYRWTWDPYRTSDLPISMTILRTLSVGTSPIILAASLLGVALLARRKRDEALLLISFPLAYLAFFLLGSDLFYARFAIPLLPFIGVLAGCGAMGLIRLVRPGISRGIAGTLAVMLLALPPTALDVKHDSLLRAEDTRLLLGRWIEANVPPSSKMAIEGYTFVDTRGRALGPKKIPYSLEILPSLRVHPLDYYIREKFDYLVVSSYVYARYPLNPDAHAEAIRLYQQMDRQLELAAAFFPTNDGRELPFIMDEEITPIYTVFERDRPGPTIKVYRVGQPPKYGADWLEANIPREMAAGQRVTAQVTVRNTGDRTWPVDGYCPVRIGYRWLDSGGQQIRGAELHSPLPKAIEPGEEATADVEIEAPAHAGAYTLQLDLVQENFAWLSEKGAATKNMQVTVR